MTTYWSRFSRSTLTRRRALAATGSAGVAAALLAACGGSDSKPSAPKDASGLLTAPVDTTSQAKRGGVIKRNGNTDGTLDPYQSVGGVSPFLEIIYTRLVTWK